MGPKAIHQIKGIFIPKLSNYCGIVLIVPKSAPTSYACNLKSIVTIQNTIA